MIFENKYRDGQSHPKLRVLVDECVGNVSYFTNIKLKKKKVELLHDPKEELAYMIRRREAIAKAIATKRAQK